MECGLLVEQQAFSRGVETSGKAPALKQLYFWQGLTRSGSVVMLSKEKGSYRVSINTV